MRISDWSSDVCSSDLGLDPGDVVDVDVERALDGRDRLLVEIGADRRQRGGMVRHFARRDAAEIDVGGARPGRLVGKAGNVTGIIVEMGDQIGRAASRERVCQYVSISVGAGT